MPFMSANAVWREFFFVCPQRLDAKFADI